MFDGLGLHKRTRIDQGDVTVTVVYVSSFSAESVCVSQVEEPVVDTVNYEYYWEGPPSAQ